MTCPGRVIQTKSRLRLAAADAAALCHPILLYPVYPSGKQRILENQCLEFHFELLSCLRSYTDLNATDGGYVSGVMFENYKLLLELLLVCWCLLGVFSALFLF